ncbi:Beta-glucanase [Dactylellina cionopaga]|nr:Beta-glucanase [Dactylellina cionopaga]
MWTCSNLLLLSSLLSFTTAQYDDISFERTTSAPIPNHSGFGLTWYDKFSQPPALNPQNWKYDIGTSYPSGPPNWGTGEIQTYTSNPSNVFISPQGHLTIQPFQNPRTGIWTSARIETVRDDFKCQPGGQMIIEASILLPTGGQQLGVWAAFWAMGSPFRRAGNHGWPATGEWDIMEVVNGENTIVGTVHCGVSPGGPCNEPYGVGGNAYITRGKFNSYSLRVDRTSNDWREEYLAWSVNGVEYHRVEGATIGDYKTWASLVHEPFFILLNVAMGGAFPNAYAGRDTPTAETASGMGMLVDWVAVHNK